jgi:hypothetical protein
VCSTKKLSTYARLRPSSIRDEDEIFGLVKNPKILDLKIKITKLMDERVSDTAYDSINVNLVDYVRLIINTPLEEYTLKYDPTKAHFRIFESLSDYPDRNWSFLKEFKSVPGIYQFIKGNDSYIGSTADLFNRCNIQHKNQAFTQTNKHKLFYTKVIENDWESFLFKILYLIPNHVVLFAKDNPDYIIREKDFLILRYLISYELTIAEQLHLDYHKPSLNCNLLANWSSYNSGSKGNIRSDEQNDDLSLSFLNRSFTDYTKELHRKNNKGKLLSEETKIKISNGSGGITVYLIDVQSNNNIIEFKTKTSLSKELKISVRTINRWLDDGKLHSTRSLKYPKVKIMSCLHA